MLSYRFFAVCVQASFILFFLVAPTADGESLFLVGLRLRLQDLLCDIMIVYLRMTSEKVLNSCNKSCTLVYKQSSSCKINYTKVEQTATKLHKSPDETDRTRIKSFRQMRDSDSTSLASNISSSPVFLNFPCLIFCLASVCNSSQTFVDKDTCSPPNTLRVIVQDSDA